MIAAISAASLSAIFGVVALAMTPLPPWAFLLTWLLPGSFTILGGAARVLLGNDDPVVARS
jgi:hypothetical protein